MLSIKNFKFLNRINVKNVKSFYVKRSEIQHSKFHASKVAQILNRFRVTYNLHECFPFIVTFYNL